MTYFPPPNRGTLRDLEPAVVHPSELTLRLAEVADLVPGATYLAKPVTFFLGERTVEDVWPTELLVRKDDNADGTVTLWWLQADHDLAFDHYRANPTDIEYVYTTDLDF